MPQSDSVPVLKEYALHNDINSKKWSLVTGDKDEIYAIARTGYFVMVWLKYYVMMKRKDF